MQEYEILPRSKLFYLYDILDKENIPQHRVVAIREIDISSIERLRAKLKTEHSKPTYTSFIAKAIAKVLQEMPHANRATMEFCFFKRIYRFLNTHVSVAVERDDADSAIGGAFVYTIYNTDKKSLGEITQEISGLAAARLSDNDPRLDRWKRMVEGVKLTPFIWIIQVVVAIQKNIPSLYVKNRGGAAMISSPSKYGVDFIVAHWPYTLGVSFGFAKERPWVEAGNLVVRKTMPITLAFDRRVISGADAARFMNRMCELLEHAEDYFNE